MNEDTNIQAPEEIIPQEEAAFNAASAGIELHGITLKPFSPARERAAQAMGMKMPMWKPEDFSAMAAGGVYAGALRDVFIYLWVCSIPTQSEADEAKRRKESAPLWTVQRAERNPDEAYEVAATFCEEHGFLLGSNKFMAAYEAVVKKGHEILSSRFIIENPNSGGEGDNVGNG